MKKKFTHPPILRAVGIFLLMLMWSFQLKAQVTNNPVLSWDKSVGCIEYDDEIKDREKEQLVNLLENIEEGRCIRFCEKSEVNYTLQANNVANVQWIPTGGNLNSSSNNSASITWGTNGGGNLTLVITYTNNTTETYNICVEKIISPTASFQIDGPDPHQKEFCVNTPISFDNLSTHNNGSAIVNYFWDFGDPNVPSSTSSLFEPTYTYSQPGSYKVKLTVTNSCNCSSDYYMEIHVKDTKPIDITCTNVTCEYSRETYTANDECGGEWKVIGGTIVNNYGTSIEVVWDQVDPVDGFGYVSYLSKCSCPFWTTVKIPVILQNGKIQGPDIICQGKQGRFSLPQWPTTDFQWSLSPSGTGTSIALTDQRNEIVIDALTPGTYTLYAQYRNTLLAKKECMGRAEFKFTVVENVSIITDPVMTLCQGASKTFSSSNGNNVIWEISLNNAVIHTETNTSISYPFNQSGIYVITANNNGCISDPVVVEVLKSPVFTGTITGPDKVCLNVPYTYSITENDPGFDYIWTVSGGATLGSNSGTQVDVVFTTLPGVVRVVKQISKNGTTCTSKPISYKVSEIKVNPIIINDSGASQFCPSSATTFTANLNGVVVDHIEWSIVSSTGATNFGNIIDGINSPNVKVSFNEITSSSTGTLVLKVTKCGKITTVTYPINLVTIPNLTLQPIGNVCPGSSTITLNVGTSNPAFNQVMVSFNGGTPVGPYTFTNNQNFSIPNGFSNNTGSNVSQNITVILNVCNRTASVSQNVLVFPMTQIDITPGYHYIVCPTNYQPITLSAGVSTGITSSVLFEWYHNNNLVGNSSDYTISGPNPGGSYYVKVRDINQCWVTSTSITVIEKCGSSPGCTITPDPNVQINASWTSCNEITASVTYAGSPTSIQWLGSPKLNITGAQGGNATTFGTNVAGNHTVSVVLDYNGCLVSKSISVAKNYEAGIKTAVTCNANNSYNVTLFNNSMTYGNVPITYTFSGPGIPANTTGQSYTVNNLSPGTYTYTLTLSSPGKPTCSVPVTVTLDPIPNLGISISPNTYCAEEPIILNIPGGYNSNYQYQWYFGTTSFVASQSATKINIPTAGTYPVRLKITTPYGCSYESASVNVTILKASFKGSIAPDPADFCEGSVQPLYFSPAIGSATPSNMIWMRDNTQVGTGLTYTPTQSGNYWAILIDAQGCKWYGLSSKGRNVIIRKRPAVNMSGNTSVCYGGAVNLTGKFTDTALEYRWIGPGVPATHSNWNIGTAYLNLTINGLAPGTYTYTFEVRPTNDLTCGNSKTMTVVIHPQVTPPTVTYYVSNCQPYTLTLTASGPSNGIYNWSNGATGQVIEVTHGGAYSVTYTAPSGCTATGYIQTPHNPERFLWVVPSGCYTLCLNKDSYLLGPLGIYQEYEWLINGGVSQSGSYTSVPIQPITMAGSYQLAIKVEGCTFKSNTLHVTPDVKNCDVKPCGIRADVKYGGYNEKERAYIYYFNFYNPQSYNITVNIGSFNNFGTYSPSSFNLSPGWNSFGPVLFYPNSNYTPGVQDFIMVQMNGCMDLIEIKTEYQGRSAAKQANEIEPTLVLSPNPATDVSKVTFALGTKYQKAQNIVVYDIMGVQRSKQQINGSEGEVDLNVSHLTPGTYVVSLEADGKRIVQQKLIKK